MSKVQTISVISFLAYGVIIGCLVFSRGFLLNRQVKTDKAAPCHHHRYSNHNYNDNDNSPEGAETISDNGNGSSSSSSWCNQFPVFKKAILILVDALRHDFVGRMPYLSSTLQTQGELTCMFRFVADPPTTTMQRLKALMTGTMPTFIDASANFNSYEVEEDSLIYQWHAHGKRLAFLGDDTWLSLFPPKYFTSPVVEAHPSFNAWDLDTVDRLVNHSLRHRVFPTEGEGQWDVLIAHLLGVDHCGHRYGPAHPEMKRKLLESDEIIQFVHEKMEEDTLLVIFGDHGMTSTGDHGGDSQQETDSAVIFISKSRRLSPGFQCPKYNEGIMQIDLVPTLATLMGLPVPHSNVGQLIPNFLPNRQLYAEAVSNNARQVHRYLKQIGLANQALTEEFTRMEEAPSPPKQNALAHRYLTSVKFTAGAAWTRFNLPMIYTGISISSLALVSLAVYLAEGEPPTLLLSWLWPSLPIWSVLWSALRLNSGLVSIIICTLAGLSMFLLGLVWNWGCRRKGTGGGLWALLIYSFTCLAVLSNSYQINEGQILGSVLVFVLVIHAVFSSSPDISPRCSLASLLLLGMGIRLSSIYFRCREELQGCSEEWLLHKQLSSLPEEWLVQKYVRYSVCLVSLACSVVAFRLRMLHQKCLSSRAPAAIIAKFVPSLLVVMLGVFWALQGLPFSGGKGLRPILNYFQGLFQATAGVSLLLVWAKPGFHQESGTLQHLPHHKTKMNGLIANGVKGASAAAPQPQVTFMEGDNHSNSLLLFSTLVIILLTQITSVGLGPAVSLILPLTIICLIALFRQEGDSSWTPVVGWTLASQYGFYATGHQPIFSAIPWDSAFLGGGDFASDSGSSWIRPALVILGNLHVSQVVFSLSFPLLAYWGNGGKKGREGCKRRRRRAYVLGGKFILLHGVKLLCCMICCGWHRRHLMVWKIFAPKLIFEAVSFLLTTSTVILSLVFLTRVDYLFHRGRHKSTSANN